MSIKVPENAKSVFKNNQQGGGNIELPFACPPFYIVNGDAKLAALQNFQYFGGFACSEKNLQAAVDHWDNLTLPIPGLGQVDISDDNGNIMPSYGARSLLVTIIGMREFSTIRDENGATRRVPPFTKGGRPGIQVVSILGYRDQSGTIFHWAPIMITAKGYQVNHIKNAVRSWRKFIEPVIKKLVPDTDPSAISNLFWMSIGTFGKERKQELVGTGEKKAITPVTAYIPETIDETKLEQLYVGEVLAQWMTELALEAEDWFNVFHKKEAESKPSAASEPEFVPPPEDDIPF